jgi:hypothetical protein
MNNEIHKSKGNSRSLILSNILFGSKHGCNHLLEHLVGVSYECIRIFTNGEYRTIPSPLGGEGRVRGSKIPQAPLTLILSPEGRGNQ